MTELYEGCWHKLDRAKKHVDTFKQDLRAWFTHPSDEPAYRFRKEFDPDTNNFSIFIVDVAIAPTEWSLIIGDALTNFRAALDYLAHDLVGRGSRPHLSGTGTPQFVICRDSKHSDELLNRRMPGIQAAHRAIIESYQPYNWLAVRELHPFLLLNTLVNRDKHREIEPIFAQQGGELRMSVFDTTNFVVERVEPGRDLHWSSPRLESDTEAMRIFGQPTGPNPEVIVRFESTINIAFESGVWAEDTLDQIGAMIAELFSEVEPVL